MPPELAELLGALASAMSGIGQMVILGHKVENEAPLLLGEPARKSGLYILGKSGMGKSTLLVNLIIQDIYLGNSVFFLDPHGQAIKDVIERSDDIRDLIKKWRVFVLDPADEVYSFGINPLYCKDPSSLTERATTYARVTNIFHKLWEKDWGVWMQRVIENTAYVFIENQEYTLAEVPLFLTDIAFRKHLLAHVKYNTRTIDFWEHEFKPDQAQPALTRIGSLLSHEYVRHIVGQRKTTINLAEYTTNSSWYVFVKLSANLPQDIKNFIGTIITSELGHAIKDRPEESRDKLYGLYVDEFQHFATDQFAELINEGRKFGCAITLAHQNRESQFGENQKILGATAATANKVLFQIAPKDAKEFAPEFAESPTAADTKWVQQLVISKQPVWDLLDKGHVNPRVQLLAFKHFGALRDRIRELKDEAERAGLIRMGSMDEAAIFRDMAAIAGLEERAEGRRVPTGSGLGDLGASLSSHRLSAEQTLKLQEFGEQIKRLRDIFRLLSEYLTAVMEGRATPKEGNEGLAEFLDLATEFYLKDFYQSVRSFFIRLAYGDPKIPRVMPIRLAVVYMKGEFEKYYMNHKDEYYEGLCRELEWEKKYLREWIVKLPAYTKDQFEYFKTYKMVSYQTYPVRLYHDRSESELQDWLSNHKEYIERHQKEMEEKIKDIEKRIIPERKQLIRDSVGNEVKCITDGNIDKCRITVDQKTLQEYYLFPLPELPAKIYNHSEREEILRIAFQVLIKGAKPGHNPRDFFDCLRELIELAELLRVPEHHIKTTSGQYIEKPVAIRSVADMVNEMTLKLTNTSRFKAYAKIIKEDENGEQKVWKGLIKTMPSPEVVNTGIEGEIREHTRAVCCNRREVVEQEIRERMRGWRGSDQPPPRGSARAPYKQPPAPDKPPPRSS